MQLGEEQAWLLFCGQVNLVESSVGLDLFLSSVFIVFGNGWIFCRLHAWILLLAVGI